MRPLHSLSNKRSVNRSCSDLYCPAIQELAAGTIKTLPHADLLQDDLGNCWCHRCTLRHDLVNFGKAHGWPAVNFPPYALAQGQDMWLVTAKLGDDERVQALAIAVGLTESE